MQPDPHQYTDPTDEGDDADALAEDEANAAPAPVSGYKTLGGALGAALNNLDKTLKAKGIDITRPPKTPEKREEEEKTETLPLYDEEQLLEIEDLYERARIRRNKIQFYKNRPDVREYYEERSRQMIAERNKPILLEPWANDRRAAPNAVFRSALFPALNSQTRKFIKEKKVYSVGGLDVTFTGEQFDQSDLDVYLEILNLAKAVPLGKPIKFSAYAMLKALGRATGNANHKWLHSVLIRLRGGTVEMVTDKARLFGGLIEGGIRDEITKHYDVVINPSYAKFFGFGLWSSLDLDQRRALEKKSIAKALHAYYSTHTDPAPHRYDTLAGVVGLENKNSRDLKAKLIKAHEELKRVGFLLDYEAGPDKIAIKATMTPGQQQHLVRKVAKAAKPLKTP